jgi:uncharacterized protein (TIGR03067 family)
MVISVSICLLSRAEDPMRGEAGRSDRQLLQGTWKVVKRVKDGQDEDPLQHPAILKISGNGIDETRDGKPAQQGTFSLDEAKSPKRITLTGKAGPDAGKVFEAIYEVDGNTFKLAYSIGDHAGTPPKDFTGGEGAGLLVLERQRQE